ncbi:hypothetical protein H5410_038596 [Solanum commersonii]|uniref:Uncharacterized protein n=1 Tax=Solanum commersonii TaxID=4109 RepID=A0A9J5YDM2_SOLCO|nr:hypothetical protein H5410_038596 [Solanum commersonii]
MLSLPRWTWNQIFKYELKEDEKIKEKFIPIGSASHFKINFKPTNHEKIQASQVRTAYNLETINLSTKFGLIVPNLDVFV